MNTQISTHQLRSLSPKSAPAVSRCSATVENKRLFTVLASSLVVAALSVIPPVVQGRDCVSILLFASLEAILGVSAFRWWYHPLYRTSYNYFSPLALVNTLGYLYAGPGNTFSLAGRDDLYGVNEGVSNVFIFPLIAVVLGTVVFDVAYRCMSRQMTPTPTYPMCAIERVLRNRAAVRPYLIVWIAVVVGINAYLGSKYLLTRASSVDGVELDNILSQSRVALLMMGWAAISVLFGISKSRVAKAVSCLLFALLIPYVITLLSRQFCIRFLVCTLFVVVAVKGRTGNVPIRSIALISAAAVLSFIAISSFRYDLGYGRTAVEARTGTLAQEVLGGSLDIRAAGKFLREFNQGRLAGLEFVSAIENSRHTQNLPWMFGYHNWLVMARSVPRLLWAGKPQTDPEVAINRHYGLEDVDQLSLPFSSAYADGGVVGVVIGFAILGVSMCFIQHWVWRLENGFLLYMGSMSVLLNYEAYLLEYPLAWIRCLLVLVLVDASVRAVTKPVRLMFRSGR